MPIINLESSFDDAKIEGEKQKLKLPVGTHKVICKNAELKESKKGTPQLEWTFEVVESQNKDLNGKQLKSWTPLPHNGNNRGIGFIVDLTAAFGKPWSGSEINTDDYIGQTCNVNVEHDGDYARIASFVS